MAASSLRWLLRLSDRLYRALLRTYPASFRRAYAPAMAQLFRDCCRDAYERRGASGLLRVWRHTLGDLLVTATWERIAAIREWLLGSPGQEVAMPRSFPVLRELARVIPVNQTQTHAAWTVTFVSLERWEGAVVANFNVHQDDPALAATRDGDFGKLPDPRLVLHVSDDRGGRYQARGYGGYGGGMPGKYRMRRPYVLTPPLDPLARELRFEVRLQLQGQSSMPGEPIPAQDDSGRWAFTIALATEVAG